MYLGYRSFMQTKTVTFQCIIQLNILKTALPSLSSFGTEEDVFYRTTYLYLYSITYSITLIVRCSI